MIDLKTILLDLIKTRDLQKWVNHRYKNESRVILSKSTLTAISEFKFDGDIRLPGNEWTYKNIDSIGQVLTDYHFTDLQPTDRVLDIGANIGIFSLLAAKKGCKVTALEPLFHQELQHNLAYNNLKATVLPYALGSGSYIDIDFAGKKARVPIITMKKIMEMYGPFNFLKCDCEGGEWTLQPEDLKGFRRLEMELHHCTHQVQPINWSLVDWIENNFVTEIETLKKNRLWLLHAYIG